MMRRIAMMLCAAFPVLAAGADAHPELPPSEIVAHLLRTSPMVTAADSFLRAEEANRARLAAGPHEWTLRLARQQREVRAPEPAQRFAEWDAGLERPIRLPGKAGTDAALGAAGVDMARIAQGDALHESSRLLMKTWFDWLRARETARETRLQADLLGRQEKGVQRRHQLGDAARLEAVQAEAASAQAEAQARDGQSREAAARMELQKRFPGLPLAAADLELPAPQPLQGTTEAWLAAILEHNHELGVARAEARKASLSARRSDQETLPDPTFGVRVARDAVHQTADGRRFLVVHGDEFDAVVRHAAWLGFAGDIAYRLLLSLNTLFNRVRRRFGFDYWSLSAFLKSRVKNALQFIDNFETALAEEARRRNVDGVICGHIHKAGMRAIDGALYVNDGDWVESCTALVEHGDGRLEILHWAMLRSWSMIDRARRTDGAPMPLPEPSIA